MTWGWHLAGKPASSGLSLHSGVRKKPAGGRLAARMAAPRVYSTFGAVYLGGYQAALSQDVRRTRLIRAQGFGVADSARLAAIARNRFLHLLRGVAASGFVSFVGHKRHQLAEPFHRRGPLRRYIDEG